MVVLPYPPSTHTTPIYLLVHSQPPVAFTFPSFVCCGFTAQDCFQRRLPCLLSLISPTIAPLCPDPINLPRVITQILLKPVSVPCKQSCSKHTSSLPFRATDGACIWHGSIGSQSFPSSAHECLHWWVYRTKYRPSISSSGFLAQRYFSPR
jgi:hypothetical protein